MDGTCFGFHNMITEVWMGANCVYHIEAETKWPPFCRRRFKYIFLNENVWISIKISLKVLLSVQWTFQHWFRYSGQQFGLFEWTLFPTLKFRCVMDWHNCQKHIRNYSCYFDRYTVYTPIIIAKYISKTLTYKFLHSKRDLDHKTTKTVFTIAEIAVHQ